ncbi:Peptidase family M28 protein [Rhizoctonia solani]|uniref:Peptide hydrolase n=1 Tax=Rhizoctonia solani TaxID=456999 RepID=A0A8H8P6M6_9AGAM|nr:Peptidase family M28 protein [Rhizoctonia solani]QRW24512.1 Peptidase family M28 protein [Rhizoctonia solani]
MDDHVSRSQNTLSQADQMLQPTDDPWQTVGMRFPELGVGGHEAGSLERGLRALVYSSASRMKSFATTAAILSLCSKHVLALPGRSYQSKELASKSYQDSITIEGLLTHAKKWQEFASSANGSRSFESEGYKLSANYVYDLAKQSGYKVTRQTVEFPRSKIHSQELKINDQVFGPGEVLALTYSPSTPKEGITAGLALVLDEPDTFLGSGCHRDDYDGLDVRRAIVFMSANGCSLANKVAVAKRARALGVVIYNDIPGQGPFQGQISPNASESLPTVMIGFDAAQSFVKKLRASEFPDRTPWGDQNNVIHIGANLDSSTASPGVNDNGSGSAAIAELLVQLAKFKPSKNAVRFSWWTNGKTGSIGSEHYVKSLSKAEKKKTALYIDVNTIASPNYIYGIYDGCNASEYNTVTPPPGSSALQKLFQEDFESKALPWTNFAFNTSSDYNAFLKAGIPVGGLSTGTTGFKSEVQVAKFGGQFDVVLTNASNGLVSDNIDNLSKDALLVNARSIAHVIATTAQSTNGIDAEKAAHSKKVETQV